ncbi:RICIN domain-containing protein [Actinoplanes sp. NPDC049681]|uniref:RICIN domain-containing protein n=1 Tax=Actinoplanes sp. NPDC049681 TaxID=3363905 RepID=UPI0037904FB5
MRTTRAGKAAAAVLAGVMLTAVSPVAAHAQSPEGSRAAVRLSPGDGRYGFMNLKSSKVLQPLNGSTANGVRVVQQTVALSGGDLITSQNWTAYDAGSGYYSFRNVHSGRALGIDGASTAAGANAIQATPDTSNNQDWRFEVYSGYPANVYRMKNRKSGLCLGISGASTANGGQAAQFRCDGTSNQGWKIIDN